MPFRCMAPMESDPTRAGQAASSMQGEADIGPHCGPARSDPFSGLSWGRRGLSAWKVGG